jgi:hypothetical protein
MQLMNNGFNNIESEWFNSYVNVNSSRDVKNSFILFKYKCEALIVMCVSIYTSKCNMQCLNSVFNKLKVDDSTHVKMLIIQEMWKKSLNHSSINSKYWIACFLVYYNKCIML